MNNTRTFSILVNVLPEEMDNAKSFAYKHNISIPQIASYLVWQLSLGSTEIGEFVAEAKKHARQKREEFLDDRLMPEKKVVVTSNNIYELLERDDSDNGRKQ